VPKLPRVTGKEMVRFLEYQGLRLIRIAGSHHFMDGNGKRTTVPVHANRPLKIGTLRSILRDIDLPPADFERLWQER
jgi:predicted RNA binding protein YcfA (HicA-like mRNA interferase family)